MAKGGVAGIIIWSDVAADRISESTTNSELVSLPCIDKFSLNSIVQGPRHKEEGVRHAASMADTGPSLPAGLQ